MTLIVALTALWYLYAWRGSAILTWRAVSFLVGLLCIWIAAASPVAFLDGRMLTAHMAQHLLLMTFAPPLIWLGEPVRLLPPRLTAAAFRSAPIRRLGRLLGHPVFCWLAAAAALVAWHIPTVFRLGMESPAWHLAEHATFLAAGLLFWWPVVQPWPAVARWPQWSMLLYLFLATLPCDVLSGVLVFSDRIAYPIYLCTPRHSELSVLADQQCAAALMWTCVSVVFVIAGTIQSTQLLSLRNAGEEAVIP